MIENDRQLKNAEDKRAHIRTRYKGVNPDELDIIPALPQENYFEDKREKRVAIYVRVSTDDPRQTSSYELQKNHYMDIVNRNTNWKLVDVYADEGISGTSLQHRDAFIRMIDDCRAGKVDLIVTKSVSRFARNVLDCIGYVRHLASLQPPICVFFETENIYTLNNNSEMFLSFISTLAQEESHNKSEIMNASIEMRFRRGIFLTPALLGYDLDTEGNLVINEEEANTVRLIFFMYLFGYTCLQIAETLTKLGCRTKKNHATWSPGSVLNILQNERHCGDVLARKTWTPNYLNHKTKKNKQERNQYRKKNHHEAIISRDDFIAVQRLIGNARYGSKGFLPELHVIPEGALRGFVSVNPRWAAFNENDYRAASDSVYGNVNREISNDIKIEAKSGDFDFRGFEIARSQFFDTAKKVCATFSMDYIQFSTECIRKLNKVPFIEMLIHPTEQLLAVRPCKKETKNAVQWANSQYYSRNISCTAFIKTLYSIFRWKPNYKYRVRGLYKQQENESVIIFDMREIEMFIPREIAKSDCPDSKDNLIPEDVQPFTIGPKKDIMAYPSTWTDNFGSNFYRHAQARELATFYREGKWNVCDEGTPFSDSPRLKLTNTEVVSRKINELINDMKQEALGDGE